MRKTAVLILIALFSAVSSASGQDTTLRYRWSPGDEVRYRIGQQFSTTMSGLPAIGDVVVDLTMAQVVRMTVQDVAADGTATIRQTFESVRLEQNSPFGKTVFDSASAEKSADPGSVSLGMLLSTMVGESVTVAIGSDGAVGKVEGMSALVDKMLTALPSGSTSFVGDQLKAFLSDDAIRSMVGQGFAMFPLRPLRTGESWTSQSDVTNPLFGRASVTRTLTLDRVETLSGVSLAHIVVRFATKQTGAPTAIFGVNANVGDSESTGEIVFDTTKGRLHHSSMKGETPIDVSLAPPGGEPIHVTGLSRSSLTLEIVDK